MDLLGSRSPAPGAVHGRDDHHRGHRGGPGCRSQRRNGVGGYARTGAPGATVCLWKGKEVYVVGTADDKGVAELEVKPSTAGEIRVAVTGPSLNATTGVIQVTS